MSLDGKTLVSPPGPKGARLLTLPRNFDSNPGQDLKTPTMTDSDSESDDSKSYQTPIAHQTPEKRNSPKVSSKTEGIHFSLAEIQGKSATEVFEILTAKNPKDYHVKKLLFMRNSLRDLPLKTKQKQRCIFMYLRDFFSGTRFSEEWVYHMNHFLKDLHESNDDLDVLSLVCQLQFQNICSLSTFDDIIWKNFE